MYFTALQAGSADLNPLGGALYHRANLLQIHIPAAMRHIVRVADLVSKKRSFAADVTYLGHNRDLLGRMPKKLVYHRRFDLAEEPVSP